MAVILHIAFPCIHKTNLQESLQYSIKKKDRKKSLKWQIAFLKSHRKKTKIQIQLAFLTSKSFVESRNCSETFLPTGNTFHVYSPISSSSHTLQVFVHCQCLHTYPCSWWLTHGVTIHRNSSLKTLFLPAYCDSHLPTWPQQTVPFLLTLSFCVLNGAAVNIGTLCWSFHSQVSRKGMKKVKFFLLHALQRLKMLWVSGYPSQRRA